MHSDFSLWLYFVLSSLLTGWVSLHICHLDFCFWVKPPLRAADCISLNLGVMADLGQLGRWGEPRSEGGDDRKSRVEQGRGLAAVAETGWESSPARRAYKWSHALVPLTTKCISKSHTQPLRAGWEESTKWGGLGKAGEGGLCGEPADMCLQPVFALWSIQWTYNW